ncbi:hypothetical protein ZWY2020_053214 [Hordeum vulgare]|nr:hypothetical protein ZWY2020_053214 [Hordeum vulgare]
MLSGACLARWAEVRWVGGWSVCGGQRSRTSRGGGRLPGFACESMGYREMQALARARGLNANGGKKDVLQRLLSIRGTSVVDCGIQDKKEVVEGKYSHRCDAGCGLRLRGTSYCEALAKARGLASNGIKKDVIERLLLTPANSAAVADGGFQDKKKLTKEEVKKEKIVKAMKKGAAVLDEHIPDDIKMTYHVLKVGDEIYDATLNQTNVGDNSNMFYITQALESDAGGSFIVFNRWGRVGARGQQKLHPYSTRDEAIYEFEGEFEDKTKNSWSNRKNFECYAKKYTWLEMDYGEVDKETTQVQKKGSITDEIKVTKLETRTAQFISLIRNISMMKQQMMEIVSPHTKSKEMNGRLCGRSWNDKRVQHVMNERVDKLERWTDKEKLKEQSKVEHT